MCNPESVLEYEMHEALWDFEIQTDHLISARRPNLVIVDKKKENLPNSRPWQTDHRVKKSEKRIE